MPMNRRPSGPKAIPPLPSPAPGANSGDSSPSTTLSRRSLIRSSGGEAGATDGLPSRAEADGAVEATDAAPTGDAEAGGSGVVDWLQPTTSRIIATRPPSERTAWIPVPALGRGGMGRAD